MVLLGSRLSLVLYSTCETCMNKNQVKYSKVQKKPSKIHKTVLKEDPSLQLAAKKVYSVVGV